MFVRGDRADPEPQWRGKLPQALGIWNYESAEYLDLVFFGWSNEGGHVGFQPILKDPSRGGEAGIFIDCCREIAQMSKFRYSGETDIPLVDFEVSRSESGEFRFPGRLSFKNCIYLPVEQMIEEKRVRSLDELVQELMNTAKEAYDAHPLQGAVFEISDRIG